MMIQRVMILCNNDFTAGQSMMWSVSSESAIQKLGRKRIPRRASSDVLRPWWACIYRHSYFEVIDDKLNNSKSFEMISLALLECWCRY